jgi:hypothetical protein
LTPDELSLRDNSPAEKSTPDELVERLRRRDLYLTVGSGTELDASSLLERLDYEGAGEVWVVKAPEETIQGLRGREANRARRPSLDELPGSEAPAESFRPGWADEVYHPKLSVGRDFPLVQRANGRIVEVYRGAQGSERRVYYPSGYPWQCIGMVFAWDDASVTGYSARASGVLVGERIVLTAVPWESSSWKMLFVPGYYDGQSVLGPGASSWVSDAHGWNADGVAAHDTAVLRLETPLGGWLGHLGTRTFHDGFTGRGYWTLAGYSTAVAGGARPSFQPGVAVHGHHAEGEAMELEHSGGAASGDSGGPLFGFWDEGPYVIGTTSGGETIGSEEVHIAAGGNELVDLVTWAREAWQ